MYLRHREISNKFYHSYLEIIIYQPSLLDLEWGLESSNSTVNGTDNTWNGNFTSPASLGNS